ncbi:MAG: hypothetical protein EOP64_00865 [Sphingomonas sp.]|nr:MAG: hypothetical protein EOP64_00865 [Sphingomonas sp.]
MKEDWVSVFRSLTIRHRPTSFDKVTVLPYPGFATREVFGVLYGKVPEAIAALPVATRLSLATKSLLAERFSCSVRHPRALMAELSSARDGRGSRFGDPHGGLLVKAFSDGLRVLMRVDRCHLAPFHLDDVNAAVPVRRSIRQLVCRRPAHDDTGTGLLNGELAWRQHEGGHTDAPNVEYFLRRADIRFGRR